MLCYASLPYAMTWRPSYRYCKQAKIRRVCFNMISNCHTLTFYLHIPVLSSGLNWSPPIVNQLVAIEYIIKRSRYSGVLRRRGQDSGWKERGEATTTACMFGRGSALRMTFESFFFFYFSENFTNSTAQAGSTGPLQLTGVFYFCKNWHFFFITGILKWWKSQCRTLLVRNTNSQFLSWAVSSLCDIISLQIQEIGDVMATISNSKQYGSACYKRKLFVSVVQLADMSISMSHSWLVDKTLCHANIFRKPGWK